MWRACGGDAAARSSDRRSRRIAPATSACASIAGVPSGAGTYRTDLLVASLAREHLWLTDAYFVATAAYTQALRAAARDGVDVRLLVPGASDIPAVSPLSRAGYRALLEAGVRVFEWNGTMLHAKTAVADGAVVARRLDEPQLRELDVATTSSTSRSRTRRSREQMAAQYEQDLGRATEIVLTRRNRVRRTEPRAEAPEARRRVRRAMSGSAGRAAAGAVSVGSALGAALTNRRTLGPAEVGPAGDDGACSCSASHRRGDLFPRMLAWPIALFAAWFGLAWCVKAWRCGMAAQPARADPGSSPATGTSRGGWRDGA